ncbi:MAG: SpoIID/LytB domain-containing protein [Candidatus Limnocylindrales bacterium]|jgi:hypothetical protein
MRLLLALALALTALMGLPTVTPPPVAQAASVCTGWPSTRVPPTTIRVLRTTSGQVQVVDFKTYVQVVMRAEWPTGWTAAALQTGAMAVKQYGWYYTMHWRGGTATGGCYDVRDDTNDQIYDPARAVKGDQVTAINETWTKSATKNGSFALMGYRPGASVACGADADGFHLYQHSSLACANDGLTVDQILHVYFDPGLVIRTPPATPSAIFFSPAEQAQVTVGASATLSWTEQLTAGTTITNRLVSLLMALPRNGSCAVDRWVPITASGWRSTAASPQTLTGLRPGRCYRAVVVLTDSVPVTTQWRSGTMLVDSAAPQATFSSPPPSVVTAITGTAATVRWTETVAPGTHIVSRSLATERAAQTGAGICAGAQWGTITSTTSASPVSSTGLGRLFCYRYRLVLTDSAGHTGTTVSGILMGPAN